MCRGWIGTGFSVRVGFCTSSSLWLGHGYGCVSVDYTHLCLLWPTQFEQFGNCLFSCPCLCQRKLIFQLRAGYCERIQLSFRENGPRSPIHPIHRSKVTKVNFCFLTFRIFRGGREKISKLERPLQSFLQVPRK